MDERPDIPRILSGRGVPQTAAEAMAHAEAKAGIRDATNVRHFGTGVTVGGALLALRQSYRYPHAAPFFHITFIPGHDYQFAFGTTAFLATIPIGIAIAIVGHMLRTRRIAQAKANPATIGIFDPKAKW